MGVLSESLAAWVMLPALLYAVSVGLGLLVTRIARFEVPNALLPPIGLSAALVAGLPLYRLDLGAWGPALLLGTGAVFGFVLARGELRARLNPGPAGVAALAVYALYIAPVVLSGGWTWTGYNFVNDTALQLQLTDHLAGSGFELPTSQAEIETASTSDAAVYFYFRAFYPLGAHALLATAGVAVPAPTAALYQPFIALLAGFGAMALSVLAARVTRNRALGALAGGLAVGANLLYVYGLQGNIKELAAFATVAIAAAVGRELLDHVRPGRAAVFALCLAAVLAVYSSAGAPFVLGIGLVVLGAAALRSPRRQRAKLWRPALVGVGVLALAGLLAATELIQSFQVVSDVFSAGAADEASEFEDAGGSPSELGQLVRPLPLAQVAGVWLESDYRFPVSPGAEPFNVIAIVVVLCLGAAGLIRLWRLREWGPLIVLVPMLSVVLILGPRLSPYAEAKLLSIASPAVVLMAALGALSLLRKPRALALAAAGVLAGAVLASNALAYHSVQLAPIDRMLALEDVAQRYEGRGELLVSEPDELVKYFMRDAANVSPFDSISPRQVQLRVPQNYLGRAFDLDEQTLVFVESAPWLVQRKAPDASRPPANFKLDYQNRFYRVWRRLQRPQVRAHLPLQEVHQPTAKPDCSELRELAGRARPGDRLVALERSRLVLLEPAFSGRPPGWVLHPLLERVVNLQTPGRVARGATLAAGPYRVWIQGSFGRPVVGYVGGRRIGQAQGINSVGQWHPIGGFSSAGGRTRLELSRGGGGLAPGDGSPSSLGALALEPLERGSFRSLAPDKVEQLCGRKWDWVELVAGGG